MKAISLEEIKQWAADDFACGHTFDSDDFNEFCHILKDDHPGLKISKKDFEKYWDCYWDAIEECQSRSDEDEDEDEDEELDESIDNTNSSELEESNEGADDNSYDRRAVESEYGLEDGELDGVSIRDAEKMIGEEDGALDRFLFESVSKDAQEVVNPTYAKALKDFEETDKKKEDALKVPEHNQGPKEIKVKATPEMKKLHLSESLFEELVTDYIITVHTDGEIEIEPKNFNDAGTVFEEVNQMSDEEMLHNDLIGVAWIIKDDEGKMQLNDTRAIDNKSDEVKKIVEKAMNDNTNFVDYYNESVVNQIYDSNLRRSSYNPRKNEEKIYYLIDNGVLDWETVGQAALSWMSDDDCRDLASYYGWIYEDEEDDELNESADISEADIHKEVRDWAKEDFECGQVMELDDFNFFAHMLIDNHPELGSFEEGEVKLNDPDLVHRLFDEYFDTIWTMQGDETLGEAVETTLNKDLVGKKVKCTKGYTHPNMGKEFVKGRTYTITEKDGKFFVGNTLVDQDFFKEHFTLQSLDEDVATKLSSDGRQRPTSYTKKTFRKPLSLQVYDALTDLGYDVFGSTGNYAFSISKHYEKNLQRAKDYLDSKNIEYKVDNFNNKRFELKIILPNEDDKVDNYFKSVDYKEKRAVNEDLILTSSFSTYKPWSGAVDTYSRIEDEGKLDQLEAILEDMYPNGMSMTGLNDLLWMQKDEIFDLLGIKDEDDELNESFKKRMSKIK